VHYEATVPTVLDRLIQQAVMQVLQRRWDRTFSNYIYGFRPGRSAHQAVAQAQQYIAEGRGWCVDLDLEKFFDRVNHHKLMGQIAKRVAGVMENGLVSGSAFLAASRRRSISAWMSPGSSSRLSINLVNYPFDSANRSRQVSGSIHRAAGA